MVNNNPMAAIARITANTRFFKVVRLVILPANNPTASMNLIIRDLSEEVISVKCELVMRLAIAAATKIIATIAMIALRILLLYPHPYGFSRKVISETVTSK
jgi:hypothetical protein